MKTRITIKDLGRILGISPSTVSRALKDHPDISPATKEKVRGLAEKYNYHPNPIALNLKHSRSNTLGVIIPEIVHYFFSSVISGIGDHAYSRGYNVIITQSNESYEREKNDIQNLLENRVDGILISISKTTRDFTHLHNTLEQGIPVVFFDRFAEEIPADRALIDDFKGSHDIVNHLVAIGAKRVAYLGTKQELSIGASRFSGYESSLKENGIETDRGLIVACDTYEDALKKVPVLLASPNPPDAIFAVNDETAVGAMDAAKRRGLRVPQDLKVAGFTNSLLSKMSDPKLTTVDQNGYLMGQFAAEMLINRLQGLMDDDYSPKIKTLNTRIIVRGSTVAGKDYEDIAE